MNANPTHHKTNDERLEEIRMDALSEFEPSGNEFSEIGMGDLVYWMEAVGPKYEKAFDMPLSEFDVSSVLDCSRSGAKASTTTN